MCTTEHLKSTKSAYLVKRLEEGSVNRNVPDVEPYGANGIRG